MSLLRNSSSGQSALEFSFILGVVLVFAMITASIAVSTFYEPLSDAVFREELQKHLTNYNLENNASAFVCRVYVTEYPGGIVEYRAGICPQNSSDELEGDKARDYLEGKKPEIREAIKARTRYKDAPVLFFSDANYCRVEAPAGKLERHLCLACQTNPAGVPIEGSSDKCQNRP